MRLLFFLPFIFTFLWAYAAMFKALEMHPKLFNIIMILSGFGAIIGFIAIFIAAALGVRV